MLNPIDKDNIISYVLTNIDNYDINLVDSNGSYQFNHKTVGTSRLVGTRLIPFLTIHVYMYQFEFYKKRRVLRIWNLESSDPQDTNIRLSLEQCEWLLLKIS